MRRLALLVASAVAIIAGSISPGLAASTNKDPGEESQNVAAATDWFEFQTRSFSALIASSDRPLAFHAPTSKLRTVTGMVVVRPTIAGVGVAA